MVQHVVGVQWLLGEPGLQGPRVEGVCADQEVLHQPADRRRRPGGAALRALRLRQQLRPRPLRYVRSCAFSKVFFIHVNTSTARCYVKI